MTQSPSGASRLDHYYLLLLQFIQPQPDASPKFAKQDAVPVLTHWSCNVFILSHALWPGLVQLAYSRLYDGASLPFAATLLLFAGAHLNMMAREGTLLINLGAKVGFLDGDQHARDQVAHENFPKTLFTVAFFSVLRPLLLVFVAGHFDAWDFTTISPWLPVELLFYAIVLDFWFYAYHRACHEIGPLWKYHKTHHLTKHPIPVLSSFSDIEQELIEVFAVPLASYLTVKFGFGLPMPFYNWWICHAFILFAEIMGHSGLRVYAVTPGLASFVLRFVGCELVIEDHDLHHRKGYRKSGNYGKQTKLWDRLFGTEMPRIESENVDFDHEVHMPFF